jgi:hypothetical protein
MFLYNTGVTLELTELSRVTQMLLCKLMAAAAAR